MKTIAGLGLSLIITAGFFGCTSTSTNNANLRNANSNTGYMTSNTPLPMATAPPMSTPMTNSSINSNMKPATNSKMNSNMMKSNMNSNR